MKCGSGFQIAVEKLKREHNLSRFDCGNPVLTSWLQKFAWTNQQADSARTYVALRENLVIGYYALAAGSVQKRESPERIARGLARHPIGVVLLARLAVDSAHQGKGMGKALLFDALKRIEEVADIIGIRAVLVSAIDDSARLFYEHFDFDASPVNPFQLMLLLKDLRKAIK
ncbi:MAG TPA: GNAT family N-acetyltransferase [Bryobacteraceae bacterium]|jgi:GNAT superfamily N-acetyltransferase